MEYTNTIDELNKETWRFSWFDRTLVLSSYSHYSRAEKKSRKWTREKNYERLSARESNIKESDVILPKYVKLEMIEQGKQQITVKMFSEYRR
jgi:hypothetical protein